MSTNSEIRMAYVNYLVSQIEQNVVFLVEQGEMSQVDAEMVISKLPNVDEQTANVVSMPRPVPAPPTPTPTPGPISNLPNTIARRTVPPPPPPRPQTSTPFMQVRATWAYNENGEDPNDLSFHKGDIFELVEETNADWWTGRLNGKQGLFPANHVEKLGETPAYSTVPPLPARSVSNPIPQPHTAVNANQAPQTGPAKSYKPFMAAHHGADLPPAPGQGVNSVGLQQVAGQEQKKSKFGKLGNTMANSAAGGVGFGAGAAIGGGLVRAIF